VLSGRVLNSIEMVRPRSDHNTKCIHCCGPLLVIFSGIVILVLDHPARGRYADVIAVRDVTLFDDAAYPRDVGADGRVRRRRVAAVCALGAVRDDAGQDHPARPLTLHVTSLAEHRTATVSLS
jgi:hypothetical protein